MSDNVREVLKQHHSSYDVTPYYVFIDERPIGAKPTTKTVKAGFDIDVFGEIDPDEAHPSPEYERVTKRCRL